MTEKTRKRDLRTRVTYVIHERVRTYAAAHQVTVYQATERLVLLGLDWTGAPTKDADIALPESIGQLAARIDVLAALADRALFGAFVAYTYARYAALESLTGDARQTRDRELLEAGQETYHRQRTQALES
ncbi:hypothetical protein [Dyella agri]|uniref:Uncharacterized protein n=1 Tax=Dyella agri TaxID=1926869 RepID=A0ABW8KIW3_9GAMM